MSSYGRVSYPVLEHVWTQADPSEATFSLASLESELVSYVNDSARHEQAFDASSVPKISRDQAAAQVAAARPSTLETITAGPSKSAEPVASTSTAAETQSAYTAQLTAIPELANYGPILRSTSKPTPLTESETEYVVSVVKHVFAKNIVFQFNVSNTIPDTVLEQVSVLMTPSEGSGLVEDFIIPIQSLTASAGSGQVYVSFTREDPGSYASGSFGCTLRFVSKEVDPNSGEPEEEGYQDEYQIEDCDLGAGDVSSFAFILIRSDFGPASWGPDRRKRNGVHKHDYLPCFPSPLLFLLPPFPFHLPTPRNGTSRKDEADGTVHHPNLCHVPE